MTSAGRHAEYSDLIQILKDRLGSKETCSELIDDYERVISSIWTVTARLLGDVGARAVISRSIRLAEPNAPLLQWVKIRDSTVDFSELRLHIPESCGPLEVLDTFLRLCVMIFQTLSELTGDAVTRSLLSHLEEHS